MKKLFSIYHKMWAKEKINLFIENINLPINSSVLDLGGGNGSYMKQLTNIQENFNILNDILIADIDEKSLKKAREKGFKTKTIDGSKVNLPFKDSEFDCIFCNSVIEHVTISKNDVWKIKNDFKKRSLLIQKNFANEICRCSKSYYVQTPHRHFPVEAHTWFPFIGYLPRIMQVLFIKFLNKFWIKKTAPDWNLLDETQMKEFFPDAKIFVIKKMGFKKEIIAIKPY